MSSVEAFCSEIDFVRVMVCIIFWLPPCSYPYPTRKIGPDLRTGGKGQQQCLDMCGVAIPEGETLLVLSRYNLENAHV